MAVRTVTRRGKTRLVIDILYTKQDGTRARYRKDAQVQTRSAALAEEKRLGTNIAKHGAVHEPKKEPEVRLLFADAVSIYLKTKAKALKARTVIGYESILDGRLIPRFGSTPIHEIGYAEAVELDAELIGAGLTESTRRNVLITLRSVLVHMVRIKKLPAMPPLPKLPKPGKKILRTLTTDQVKALLSKASPQGRLAMALAAYAGLRAGEVRALRWQDVDMARGVIVVRKAICRGVEGTPKSGHERQIPIARPLRELLDATPRTDEHVTVTKSRKTWGEHGLVQVLKRAAKRAKIGAWRFHDLRHYCITTLLNSGTPSHVVQKLAGHGSLAMLARYAHTNEHDLAEAVLTAW